MRIFDLLDNGADDPPPVITLTAAEMGVCVREAREEGAVAGWALAYWSGQQATKPVSPLRPALPGHPASSAHRARNKQIY